MNNQELELKVKEILAVDNFFDMVEATIAFNKEYKGTEFYKKTKMPLEDVIKNAKMWYGFQLNDIGNKIQKMVFERDNIKLLKLKLEDALMDKNQSYDNKEEYARVKGICKGW